MIVTHKVGGCVRYMPVILFGSYRLGPPMDQNVLSVNIPDCKVGG